MNLDAYKHHKEMLDLQEKLFFAEANRLSGARTYTVAEVSERLKELIYQRVRFYCDRKIK